MINYPINRSRRRSITLQIQLDRIILVKAPSRRRNLSLTNSSVSRLIGLKINSRKLLIAEKAATETLATRSISKLGMTTIIVINSPIGYNVEASVDFYNYHL